MSTAPVLRLPSRRPQVAPLEPESVIDRARDLVKNFRHELDSIRHDSARQNASLEPGAGLYSLYSGLGFQGGGQFQDQQSMPGTLALANSYFPISLNWTLLENTYLTQGLIRIVVDQVVEDAFGDGIKFKSGQLDDDELDQLNREFKKQRARASYAGTKIQKINLNAGYDMSTSDLGACKEVGQWGRLFGGSGLIINTTQPFDRELDVTKIGPDTPLTFIAANRWELILEQISATDDSNPVPYNYYGLRLHRSRVSRFIWAKAPSRIRRKLQGWGMSVLEECIRPVNAYLKFEKLMFELMDEAKVDVYKIERFNTLLTTPQGTAQLMARLNAANQAKNFQNAVAMDVKDEYEQKNLGSIFPGLVGLYEQLRSNLCAYMKIPMNKLFGESAGGFGSGKDALDNYNSTVRNFRTTIEPVVLQAGELRAQQLFGVVPEDLEVEWQPLSILDGVEQETVKTSQQARIMDRFTNGITTGQECAEELRKANLMEIDETEVEQGLRDVAPPLSQNPDEVEQGQDHALEMQKAKDKGKSAAKK